MDDIRRPQELKRRDYALPSHRPAPPHQHQAPNQQFHPAHQPMRPEPATPAPAHHKASEQDIAYPHQTNHPQHHQTIHPPHPTHTATAHPQPLPHRKTAKKSLLSGKKLTLAAAVAMAALVIFGAGYLLKGSSDSKGIPANITRQVNYTLYFPAPMPAGYTYMKDTATFQIGQVYYKFANGRKKVTVIEQPLTDPKPNLKLLQGYELFDSAVGKAAVGTNIGESQAVVVTSTTIITMNTVGGVTKAELKAAVNNLKNIGQSGQKT